MKGRRSRTYWRTLGERPNIIESRIMVIMGCHGIAFDVITSLLVQMFHDLEELRIAV